MSRDAGNPILVVGAGPGDPELITVAGQKAVAQAELIVYAGSLVNPAVLDWASPDCRKVDSAGLDLDEIVSELVEGHGQGLKVVRLHTGDSSLYGAIREQMDELDKIGVPWRIIPGVSAAFAAAARQYSVSPSKARGGRMDWLDLATLPPQIAAVVLGLAPGQVSDPIPVTNAVALFQMRALEETEVAAPETLSIEYARFFLERGTQDEANRVAAELDTCDDLYGVAKGQPEERLLREVKPVAELPDDIALELAKLDEGESVLFARGGTPSLLMLCGRTPALGEDVDRAAVRQRLLNQRLGAYAESYLAELRADAIIRYP